MRALRFASIVCLSALAALGACSTDDNNNGHGGNGAGGASNAADTDGDGISDADEGIDTMRDTDGDGTPDYLDLDSDGDGILDADEAGDDSTATPPVDSDLDGTPDFIDLDSDNNGVADAIEGGGDLDGDGIGNFADADNDGDGILDASEIGLDPDHPINTDGDADPDYLDTDSDNDTISDLAESSLDSDGDGLGNYVDLDSDGDCIPDSAEAGDDNLATPPIDTDGDHAPDYLDLDSDGDGLADSQEDLNCNGVVDPGESSAVSADTDGDGVSDLVEVAAGTDPGDATDNPQANGDFVFVVPYQEPPSPTDDDLDFKTDLVKVDVYVLIDRSGSMSTEIATIKANMQTVANNVTCPPLGQGTPGQCIPDIWWGAGTIGYTGANGQSYSNHLDLQPNPALVGPAIPTTEPAGCCNEPLLLGTWSTVTGQGSATSGCAISTAYPARPDCSSAPAGATGIGYPCFRQGALPLVLLTTDEAPTQTQNCPGMPTVIGAANAISARIMGVHGSGTAAMTDLRALATGTGAVDANNNNAPVVVNGADAQAATAIENGIKLLANGLPLDLNAVTVDDPSDSVDAVTAFVSRLETLQLGTPQCTAGLTDQDSNNDGFKDLYIDVTTGTPVCWKIVPKQNTTVQPTSQPQLFQATVEVYGDGITLLDTRNVYFLVPPKIDEIIIPN